MIFKMGDTIIHPTYGAGVVADVKELEFLGNEKKQYYMIELLSDPGAVVMVPVQHTQRVGLRPPIARSKLKQVWHVLHSDPHVLPSSHGERHALLKDKLRGGDIFEVAEAVRDIAWRKEQKRNLTAEGKRLYEQAIKFLSAEIAIVQGKDFTDAEKQISQALESQIAS
jgi:CarD family transcriptional regulator